MAGGAVAGEAGEGHAQEAADRTRTTSAMMKSVARVLGFACAARHDGDESSRLAFAGCVEADVVAARRARFDARSVAAQRLSVGDRASGDEGYLADKGLIPLPAADRAAAMQDAMALKPMAASTN